MSDRTAKSQAAKSLLVRALAVREAALLIFIIFLIVIVSLRSPYFFTVGNFKDILLDTAILMIVAMGQMMVIVTRGVDLSVGSGVAFSGMAVGLIISASWGIHPLLAILMGAGIGLVLGSFNGLLVAKAGIPPIITTLATMSIYRGLTFIISRGEWVDAHEMPESFKLLARGSILGIPNMILVVLFVFVVFYYFLEHTRGGRQVYAVGSNPNAARFAGINVEQVQFLVYMLSGVLYGGGGVLWVSRYASAQADSALGFELLTVASCVIGGVFIFGGSGTITGVLLGSLLLGIVVNALNLIRVSPFWKLAIQGLIILVAVISDSLISRRLEKTLRQGRSHGNR
jgi:rhamnose transport system permease protein